MTGEYRPREHDHLIEPMFHAVHGVEQPAPRADAEPAAADEPLGWRARWAWLLVPSGAFGIAAVVWALYRAFA